MTSIVPALLGMSESSYIELLKWTGGQARSDKRGKLNPLAEGNLAASADIWKVANDTQGTRSPEYCGPRTPRVSTTAPSVQPKR